MCFPVNSAVADKYCPNRFQRGAGEMCFPASVRKLINTVPTAFTERCRRDVLSCNSAVADKKGSTAFTERCRRDVLSCISAVADKYCPNRFYREVQERCAFLHQCGSR